MKSFQSLTRQISQWRRARSVSPSHPYVDPSDRPPSYPLSPSQLQTGSPWQKVWQFTSDQMVALFPSPKPRRRSSRMSKGQAPIVLAIAVLSLTSTIGYRFYNEPQLAVGSVSPETYHAPDDAAVEDAKTTEANREAARTGAVAVLMIDYSANQQVYQNFQRLLERGDEFRSQAGSFPFVETFVLSTATQRYLRQAEEWEWRAVLTEVQNADSSRIDANSLNRLRSSLSASTARPPAPSAEDSSRLTTASRQLAIVELQGYMRRSSAEDWRSLQTSIERSRSLYQQALVAMTPTPNAGGATVFDISLLQLTDEDWIQLKEVMRTALERMLQQGIPRGIPEALTQQAIRAQVANDAPIGTEGIAVAVLSAVEKPNLIEDPEQTRLRAEQAAREVTPVVVEIRRGELIVQRGETITQEDFVLLDHFNLSQRQINWFALIALASLVSGAIAVFLVVERLFHPGLRRRDHALILLLVLSAPLVAAVGVPGTSLPAIALLISSFYGSALGITVVGLLSVIMPVGMDMGLSALIASAVGSWVGAVMAGRLRSREELALLGLAVGLSQGTVYLILSLIATSASPVWLGVLTTAGIQGLMGIAWSVVALGISPYLEHVFDLVTPIRLVELTNPNRPLLQRLASEAPGTFQHTLFVASLAEAAARELGCNVELVRAGTLYHDIGKMHDPLGFIENQMGGPNKHDQFNDPWRSAALIKKHVTEGLVMARKCRLPKAIQAFIPEHQGTMLITYFHHQAKQRAEADPSIGVCDDDFRYDGPIPQSRETGIVMLADSCEAALRSLKDTTPEEALAMVNRILRARWQDDQLVDSGLTRAEMSKIAEIFVRVWQQFNHQRIAYPKAALNPNSSVLK